MLKRLFDILISALLLSLILLPLGGVCLLILLESSGSPFFSHPRVGRNGRVFGMVKFRSMVKDAAAKGSFRTETNDTRITKVGAVLRKTSLDELPQLWNVLVGDMSLIGPRPDTPMQENDYTPEQWRKRCSVRPGITGLAQVMGRSGLNHEQRIAYDMEYAENATLKKDIEILMKTVSIVLKRAGTN